MKVYTDHEIDILLNGRFRDGGRPKPYLMIAAEMGIEHDGGLDDLEWKVITGYSGNLPDGPRRVYVPGPYRESRAGKPWTARDDSALRMALAGEGQLRSPACDVAYIAAVLARSTEEVEARWAGLNPGRTGTGFGLRG